MSKPMTRSKPALSAVRAIATTPPAGPERMASLPAKRFAEVRPPDDIMNMTRAPVRSTSSACDNAPHVAGEDRRQIGVDHGRVAAPDELDQGRAAMAFGDLRKAERAGDLADQRARARDSGRRA